MTAVKNIINLEVKIKRNTFLLGKQSFHSRYFARFTKCFDFTTRMIVSDIFNELAAIKMIMDY